MLITTSRAYLAMGFYILLVAFSAALKLSLAVHFLNVAATFAALLSAGMLALLLFRIRRKLAAIVLGSLAVFAWSVTLLGFGAVMLFEGNSRVTLALEDGKICQGAVYGFVTGDSGEELEIYRRFLFVDYKIHHQIDSAVYLGVVESTPPGLENVVARCRAKVNEARLMTG